MNKRHRNKGICLFQKKRYKGNTPKNKYVSLPCFYENTNRRRKHYMEEKEKLTYTKADLIKSIARDCGFEQEEVRMVYESLDQHIFEALGSATEDADVTIRLFDGVSMSSTFEPKMARHNNLTDENIISLPKVRPKAKLTRNYRERLTRFAMENNMLFE